MVNGFRSLREASIDACDFKVGNVLAFAQTHDKDIFLVIMLVGLLVSAASLAVIITQIYLNQANKERIMAILGLLNTQ